MNGAGEREFTEWYSFEQQFDESRRKKRPRDALRHLVRADVAPHAPELDFFEYRARRLETVIASMREELYARLELGDHGLQQIDYQIAKAAFALDSFTGFGIGYNVGVDVKRNQLERQLGDLRKERRNLETRAWSDIVGLRRDLRKVQHELADCERRGDMARG